MMRSRIGDHSWLHVVSNMHEHACRQTLKRHAISPTTSRAGWPCEAAHTLAHGCIRPFTRLLQWVQNLRCQGGSFDALDRRAYVYGECELDDIECSFVFLKVFVKGGRNQSAKDVSICSKSWASPQHSLSSAVKDETSNAEYVGCGADCAQRYASCSVTPSR